MNSRIIFYADRSIELFNCMYKSLFIIFSVFCLEIDKKIKLVFITFCIAFKIVQNLRDNPAIRGGDQDIIF